MAQSAVIAAGQGVPSPLPNASPIPDFEMFEAPEELPVVCMCCVLGCCCIQCCAQCIVGTAHAVKEGNVDDIKPKGCSRVHPCCGNDECYAPFCCLLPHERDVGCESPCVLVCPCLYCFFNCDSLVRQIGTNKPCDVQLCNCRMVDNYYNICGRKYHRNNPPYEKQAARQAARRQIGWCRERCMDCVNLGLVKKERLEQLNKDLEAIQLPPEGYPAPKWVGERLQEWQAIVKEECGTRPLEGEVVAEVITARRETEEASKKKGEEASEKKQSHGADVDAGFAIPGQPDTSSAPEQQTMEASKQQQKPDKAAASEQEEKAAAPGQESMSAAK